MWCGLLESKIRFLIINLEREQHVTLAQVNPNRFEYAPIRAQKQVNENHKSLTVPTAPFCSMWFIGLEFDRAEKLDVNLTGSINYFIGFITKNAVSEFDNKANKHNSCFLILG